jgi:hypothetical protein
MLAYNLCNPLVDSKSSLGYLSYNVNVMEMVVSLCCLGDNDKQKVCIC